MEGLTNDCQLSQNGHGPAGVMDTMRMMMLRLLIPPPPINADHDEPSLRYFILMDTAHCNPPSLL